MNYVHTKSTNVRGVNVKHIFTSTNQPTINARNSALENDSAVSWNDHKKE